MNSPEVQGAVAVSLPIALIEKIRKRIDGTGFASPESYIEFVLRELLSEDNGEGQGFTPEDEERIKQRLRALGYLD